MIYGLLIALFIIVAFLMVFVILIQSGKGGGLAGIAGGMGAVFGGRGSAPFLVKATSILAAAFMIIALLLGMMTKGVEDKSSMLQRERERRAASPARTLPQVEVPDMPAPGN